MARKRTRLYISSLPSTDGLTKKAIQRIHQPSVGLMCSKEWHKLCKPYIPYGEGSLSSKVEYKPFEIIYKEKYAHYQYTGIVYEDPVYKVGGFQRSDGSWYSRPRITKVPRTIPTGNRKVNLQYKKPTATDHWDIAAQNAGKDKELVKKINRYVNVGHL